MPDQLDDDNRHHFHVTPRYLAGSTGNDDAVFPLLAHWPHRFLDYAPSAAGDVTGRSRPHRVVRGRHPTLAHHRGPGSDRRAPVASGLQRRVPSRDHRRLHRRRGPQLGPVHVHHRLLQPPARCVEERVEPLLQAGWQRGFQEQLKIITVEAPDGLAGAENDTIDLGPSSAGGVRLWCGPFTARADAVFPPGPPDHLVASVAAMADPEPLTRERNMIRREVEPLVRLAPVETTAPSHSQTAQPTRLDRAAYKPYGVARARAARTRTTSTQLQPGITPSSSTPADSAMQTPPRPRR